MNISQEGNRIFRRKFLARQGGKIMTVEQNQELVNRLRKGDISLTDTEISKIAEQAIKDGNMELQQATVFHPNAAVEMASVYMQKAKEPGNFIYGLRLELAGNPEAHACTLMTLAQVAIKFHDEELRQAIESNPVATEEIKEMLQKS